MTSQTIYHYVYRITNIVENKHYYGKRSSKCDPKQDLGIKYFSSSKDKVFKADQKNNPQNYRYKIVRIFASCEAALNAEILLHEKFDVALNPNFYNKANQTSTGFDTTGKAVVKDKHNNILFVSINDQRYISGELIGVNSGKIHTTETRLMLSNMRMGENNSFYGKTHSDKTRKLISENQPNRSGKNNTFYGKTHSIESKIKMKKPKESLKGIHNFQFRGYYITPEGKFETKPNLLGVHPKTCAKWCKKNKLVISAQSFYTADYLNKNFDSSIIGKTYEDIGFSFIEI